MKGHVTIDRAILNTLLCKYDIEEGANLGVRSGAITAQNPK
jgi:hypothetical protein